MFFDTNDIPQDSQTMIDGFKKRVRSQNEHFDKETNKCFREMHEIMMEKIDLQEKIALAMQKLEILEEQTGNYGLYFKELTKSTKEIKK